MYTECQKCGYQFVKSDSKTINNIGKNIYINGHLFGVETKGKPQSTNQAEKWYKYLSMKVVYGEPLLSTEHIYNKTSIY